MRAPVAAQVRDWSLLLLKSISKTIVGLKLRRLAFDKAVLPKRRKNLTDGSPRLCVNVRTTRRPRNGG
jgi:hypothetical protein